MKYHIYYGKLFPVSQDEKKTVFVISDRQAPDAEQPELVMGLFLFSRYLDKENEFVVV